jgi:hypothetical protein
MQHICVSPVICLMRWSRTRCVSAVILCGFAAIVLSGCSHDLQQPTVDSKYSPATNIKSSNIYFATYGDDIFSESKKRIVKQAEQTGWFRNSTAFGPESLSDQFKQQYSSVLSQPRGGGYWIWKFPVFEMMLNAMDEGDILVYADAGCTISAEGQHYFYKYVEMLRGSPYDIISFQRPENEFQYTTDHIFRAFGVNSATDPIRTSGQYIATVLIMQKGPHLRTFLDLCNSVLYSDPWLITDRYNENASLADNRFLDNRHDQSIMSVARKLLGSLVIKDSTYPPNIRYPFSASRIRKLRGSRSMGFHKVNGQPRKVAIVAR